MNSPSQKRFRLNILALLAIIGIGAIGVHLQFGSSASSINPYGYIDSCVLSGSTTVLHGWAADPQVTTASVYPYVTVKAGTAAQTVPTNLTTYRTTAITNWIKANRAGDPTPGEYGFTAQFTGLYKGNSYAVSGIALNYGAGTNVALGVNTGNTLDGAPANGFPGHVLPDACLAAKPAPPPTPTPTPSPTPTPKPSPKPGGGSTTPATPSNVANATVAVGTTAADVKIPAGNAAKVHITYAHDGLPGVSTPDVAVSGSTATIHLNSLIALTTYTYTITRSTSAGASATSPSASFTTSGYSVTLHFVNSSNQPVKGIKGTLSDADGTTATTGDDGTMTFTGLAAGSYTLTYNYNHQDQAESFDTSSLDSSAGSEDTAAVINLTDTINVDYLSSVTNKKSPETKAAAKGGHGWLILFVVVVVAVVLVVVVRLRFRRSKASPYAVPDIIDQTSHRQFAQTHAAGAPPPEHMGESLRDMVIKSMHEEAARRRQPPSNPAP